MKTSKFVFAAACAVALVFSGCSKEESTKAKTPTTATAAAKVSPESVSPPKITSENIDAAHRATLTGLTKGGIAYLLNNQQPDGSWCARDQKGNPTYVPALTALVVKTLLAHPDFDPATHPDNPVIAKAIDRLMTFRQKDGGFYTPSEGQAAYTTAIVVMALKATGNPKYNEAVDGGVKYLKGLQIVPGQESSDGKKIAEGDPRVGGVGYGKSAFNPNLSTMHFVMDAWETAGVSPDDPAVQNALGFISRLQNRTENNGNNRPSIVDGPDDSGFIYGLEESKAGPQGKGFRSYGTMTYAGFKSLLYAGVAKSDGRVQGAYTWIRKHWDMDHNPNMPGEKSEQGLYYFYNVFAKALRAWGEPTITEIGADGAEGPAHNWRQELIDALAKRVQADGSWTNNADRWEEGSPVLVTCYTLMALEEAAK